MSESKREPSPLAHELAGRFGLSPEGIEFRLQVIEQTEKELAAERAKQEVFDNLVKALEAANAWASNHQSVAGAKEIMNVTRAALTTAGRKV